MDRPDKDRKPAVREDMVKITLDNGGEVLKTGFDALVQLFSGDRISAISIHETRIKISEDGHIIFLSLSDIGDVSFNAELLKKFTCLETLSLARTHLRADRKLGEALQTLRSLSYFQAPNEEVFDTPTDISNYIISLLELSEPSDGPPPESEPPPEADRDYPDAPRRPGRIWIIVSAVNLALIGAGLAYFMSRSGDNRTAERNTAEVADVAPPPPKNSPPPPPPQAAALQAPARAVLQPTPQPTQQEVIEAPDTINGNFELVVFALNAQPTMITLEGALEGDGMAITIGNPFPSKDDETVSLVRYTIALRRGNNTYVQSGVTLKDFFDVFSEDEATDTFEVDGRKYPVKKISFGDLALKRVR